MVKVALQDGKWIVLPNNSKEGIYIDGYLKKNLDDLKKAIEMKWDGIGFYCGYEGDGKTVKASQDCFYMDSTFNLDRCVFTPQQFIEAIDKAKPGQAILFDEAHAAFAAARWMESAQQALISMLTRIRRKRLFIAIVSPTFFDMKKYIVIHRSRYMVHVYAQGLERGRFSFYGRDKKKSLYVLGKKTENMRAVKSNFFGRFSGFFPFKEEEYDNKKEAAEKEMISVEKKPSKHELRWKAWCLGLFRYFLIKGMSGPKLEELINNYATISITSQTIYENIDISDENKGVKEGSR